MENDELDPEPGEYEKQRRRQEMPIKGLSEEIRIPRLGYIKLGEEKDESKVGPGKEMDYFRFEPNTGDEKIDEQLREQFKKLYGEKAKRIRIMFPLNNPEKFFPQWYQRRGQSSGLKCRGDGGIANVIGEEGFEEIECNPDECPYFQKKECRKVATLQVLVVGLKGAGVWHIITGSRNSIINLNSVIKILQATRQGKISMLPLTLQRAPQEIQHMENGKSKTRMHYPMSIDVTEIDLPVGQTPAIEAPVAPKPELAQPPAPPKEEEKIKDESPSVGMTKHHKLQQIGDLMKKIAPSRFRELLKIYEAEVPSEIPEHNLDGFIITLQQDIKENRR